MGFINFDLTNVGSLHTLASPGAGAPGTLPPGLATTGGLYLIVNQATQNRYIGKSGNLQDRFEGRMLAVNEFGLTQASLANIGAFWGAASPFHTPAPVGSPPAPAPLLHTLVMPAPPLTLGFRVIRNGAGPAAPMPAQVVGAAAGAINYGGNPVTTTIDGVTVNVEALLIRFFRQALGVGGTMTNLSYMGLFTNPTPNELIVQVQWGTCATVGIAAGHFCITIPAGGSF